MAAGAAEISCCVVWSEKETAGRQKARGFLRILQISITEGFMPITYNNLYLDIRQELRRAGIEGATLEAGNWGATAAARPGRN